MNIAELLKTKRTLSFEVFPPKDAVPLDGTLETLSRLYRFEPDFISCTYGAGGSSRGRNREICEAVRKSGYGILPHFTCVGSVREEVRTLVREYTDSGIENLMALRGDFPAGWEGTGGDFAHADELIGFLSACFPGLCLAAAAYPEKHLAAPSLEADIAGLRSKQDKGARFLMTQLCYDVPGFERFLEQARKAGITIPILTGVMPVLSREPVIRMTLGNGCSIPAELAAILGKYQDTPDDFAKAGKEYTANLIRRFLKTETGGIHLYTMNKWKALTEILLTLDEFFPYTDNGVSTTSIIE